MKLNKANEDSLGRFIEDYIEDIFNDRNVTKVNRDKLWKFYYDSLSAGVDKGFKNYGKIEVDTTDLLAALKNDIAKFSAFKEVGFKNALLDLIAEKNQLPTKKEFKERALKINNLYNKEWLNTEFDLTIAKAQSAVQWKDYESRKHLYPNLRYIAILDGRSRQSHLKFDGLTLPMDHPFWKKHLPPWDYGCRCGIDQTDDDENNLGLSLDNIPPKPGVSNNPGITKTIIANDHPVYKVSESDKKEALANLNDYQTNRFTPPNLKDYEKKLGVEIDKSMFGLLQKETPLYFENPKNSGVRSKGAYYNPVANYVKIPIDRRRLNSKWYAKAVVHHEYGHAIDWQIGLKSDKRLLRLFAESKNMYTKKEFTVIYNNVKEQWIDAMTKELYDVAEKSGAILDTIASLHNSINFVETHSAKYWRMAGKSEAEFIAHLFENKFAGNDLFEAMLPEMYKKMVEFDLLDANSF